MIIITERTATVEITTHASRKVLGEFFFLAFIVQFISISVQGHYMYKCEGGAGSGALYYYQET